MKSIHKKVFNEIFYVSIHFVIFKHEKYIKKKYGIIVKGSGTIELDNEIWVFFRSDQPLDVLVHECDHVISEIWRLRGIKKLKGIDESYAYNLQWLFDKLYKKLKS